MKFGNSNLHIQSDHRAFYSVHMNNITLLNESLR